MVTSLSNLIILQHINLNMLKEIFNPWFVIATHPPITALLYEAFETGFVVESVLEIQYLTGGPYSCCMYGGQMKG
jgi:hypothetical protein